MKKAWKILLGLFVLTVAVVVSGIAVLKSTDFNKYKGLIAEEVKAATGRDLTITGDLSLSISLNPSLSVKGVTFANAPWGTRPEMVRLKRLEAKVAILPLFGGDLRIDRLVLTGVDAILETDAKGRGNWEFASSGEESPIDDDGILPVVRKVRIEDVNLTYLDGQTGQKMKLGIDRLDADGEDGPLVFSLTGALNGKILRASGRLTDAAKGYVLDDLRLKAAKSGVAGRVVLSLPKGGRPGLKADLTSDLLDLDALLPGAKASEKAGGKAAKRLFPKAPLPLEALKAVDADIVMKVSRLVLPGGITARNVSLKTVLRDGRLSLKPVGASLAGGNVTAGIVLDGATGKTAELDVKIKARGLEAGLLARDMGATNLLSGGKTDIDIVLKGRGSSVRKLMGSLNGAVKAVLGKAKIRNTEINWVGADFLSELAQAINPMAKKDDYTVLKCGVVRFEVSNGIAKSPKGIALETDKINVIGNGLIDLKTEAINFSIRPQARQGLGISLGDQVAGLISLKGTLADPKIGLDEEEAAIKAAEVGAAIATGGISLLGSVLFDKLSADETPCRTALGLGPEKSDKKANGGGNLLDDAAEGLKGLFGLGK